MSVLRKSSARWMCLSVYVRSMTDAILSLSSATSCFWQPATTSSMEAWDMKITVGSSIRSKWSVLDITTCPIGVSTGCPTCPGYSLSSFTGWLVSGDVYLNFVMTNVPSGFRVILKLAPNKSGTSMISALIGFVAP